MTLKVGRNRCHDFNSLAYFPFLLGPSPAGRGWDQQGNNFGGPGMPGRVTAKFPVALVVLAVAECS